MGVKFPEKVLHNTCMAPMESVEQAQVDLSRMRSI